MTAQAADLFVLDSVEHALAGICGDGLFEPVQHGFTPEGKDTGCWRGYVCTYGLREERLVLEALYINHGSWQGQTYRPFAAPAFEGRAPVEQTSGHQRFDLAYENVGLPLPFNGGLLAATDFIRELYVHMGYHPAWKYRKVHELIFEDGRLGSRRDVSNDLLAYRARFVNRSAPPDLEDQARIKAWVEEAFSLDYGF
jgi:hypothetical protein